MVVQGRRAILAPDQKRRHRAYLRPSRVHQHVGAERTGRARGRPRVGSAAPTASGKSGPPPPGAAEDRTRGRPAGHLPLTALTPQTLVSAGRAGGAAHRAGARLRRQSGGERAGAGFLTEGRARSAPPGAASAPGEAGGPGEQPPAARAVGAPANRHTPPPLAAPRPAPGRAAGLGALRRFRGARRPFTRRPSR